VVFAGPAGENLATIVVRLANSGGSVQSRLTAVLGSKSIKAIIAKGAREGGHRGRPTGVISVVSGKLSCVKDDSCFDINLSVVGRRNTQP
jgi:hypothetical protein